jgi:hypothetical protein
MDALNNKKNFKSIGYLGPENGEFPYRGGLLLEIPVVLEDF